MRRGAVDALFILAATRVQRPCGNRISAALLTTVVGASTLARGGTKPRPFATWHIPQAHYLESWSDARSFDGTVSLHAAAHCAVYGGKTAHELLAAVSQQQPARDDYEIRARTLAEPQIRGRILKRMATGAPRRSDRKQSISGKSSRFIRSILAACRPPSLRAGIKLSRIQHRDQLPS